MPARATRSSTVMIDQFSVVPKASGAKNNVARKRKKDINFTPNLHLSLTFYLLPYSTHLYLYESNMNNIRNSHVLHVFWLRD